MIIMNKKLLTSLLCLTFTSLVVSCGDDPTVEPTKEPTVEPTVAPTEEPAEPTPTPVIAVFVPEKVAGDEVVLADKTGAAAHKSAYGGFLSCADRAASICAICSSSAEHSSCKPPESVINSLAPILSLSIA